MVQPGIREDCEAGAEGAALGVVGGVNDAWNARLDDRASAHAAGLECNVKSGARKAVVAKQARGFAKDDDFGVGGGVVVTNGAVAGTGEDCIVVDKHGADRNFADISRSAGFGESELHEMKIVGHQRHEDNMGKGEFWAVRLKVDAGDMFRKSRPSLRLPTLPAAGKLGMTLRIRN
jgi:hypothetical protein